MSQEYIAAFVSILSIILPHVGVTIGSDALTQTVTNIVAIVAGLWVMIRRYKRGDINILGARK